MKTGQRFFGLIVQAAVLWALAACGQRSETDAIQAAKSLMAQRDTAAATLELKSALQANPASAEARFLLGSILLNSDDPAGALSELQRALDAGYPQPQVVPLMAEALLAQNKPSDVIAQFRGTRFGDAMAMADLQTSLAAAHLAEDDLANAESAAAGALALIAGHAGATLVQARIEATRGHLEAALGKVDTVLQRTPNNVKAWQLRGDLLLGMTKGDTAPAVAAYRQALVHQPDFIAAHVALLNLHLIRRDLAAADQQWSELKKARPNHPQTRFFEAVLALQHGHAQRARELCQPLLRDFPNNRALLKVAAEAELRLRSYALAESLASRAVQLQPNEASARRLLAEIAVQTGQGERAVAALKPLQAEKEQGADMLFMLGRAQFMANDKKAAEVTLAKAARLKPEDFRIRTALALARAGNAPAEPVFNELAALAKADPETTVDIFLITARLQRREYPAARQAIDALAVKVPKDPLPSFLRGQVALAEGDAKAARQSFDAALAIDAGYYRAAERLSALDMAEGKPEAARTRLEAIAKREAGNVSVRMALAELASRTGADAERVASLLSDAVKAAPKDVVPRAALIDHLLGRDLGPAALTAAQEALAEIPEHPDLLERLGRAQLATGDSNQAITTFTRLAAQESRSGAAHMLLAGAYMTRKDVAAAGAAIRRALELEPASKDIQRAGVVAALREKQPDQALKIARQAQAQEPDQAHGWMLEGEVELAQRHFDASAAAFRKALGKSHPGGAAARLHYTLLTAGKSADAGQMEAEWRKSHPDDLGFLLHLGDLAQARKDAVTAEARYREILAKQPNHVTALNNLAFLLLSQQRQDGIPLAEQALKLAPNRPALMDTLAQGYAQAKELDKAIALQARAVAAAPTVPAYRLALSKMYIQAKDLGKARQELSVLSKLQGDFTGREEVMRLVTLVGSVPATGDAPRSAPVREVFLPSGLGQAGATVGLVLAGVLATGMVAAMLFAAMGKPIFLIQRSQRIQAPAEHVLNLLRDLRQLDRWSSWPSLARQAEKTFNPGTGPARFCSIHDRRRGTKESLEIFTREGSSKLVIERIGTGSEVAERAQLVIGADDSAGTLVQWTLSGPASYAMRLKGLFTGRERRLARGMVQSLSRLQSLAESGEAHAPASLAPALMPDAAPSAT